MQAMRNLALPVAAAAASVLSRAASNSASEEQPSVVAAIVVFRHGARAPVFKLSDASPGEAPYETLTTAPAHALPVELNGGRMYAKWPQSGLLTRVGWHQGEALGRFLSTAYGPPVDILVRSTDVSRTVLTARAVLTGLFAEAADLMPRQPIRINIESHEDSPLPLNTRCAALAASLHTGRAAHRSNDAGYAAARAAVAAAFDTEQAPGEPDASPPLLHVHDDCVARRFYGHAPSEAVGVSLCDWASRESAREVRAALREGGELGTRLSAGKLCSSMAEHLRELRAAPRVAAGPRMVLLSGHDTTLLMLLNALDAEGDCVHRGEWPPHTSHIALELRSDDTIRVVYGGGAAVLVESTPAPAFLGRLDRIAITSEPEYERLCGQARRNISFSWAD